jgi:rhombotail lipoprotein
MRLLALAALLVVGLSACSAPPVQQRAGVLDYLYPSGTPHAPPTDVQLNLPLRVGVAFAPSGAALPASSSGSYWTGQIGFYRPMLEASEKQRLLGRVVDAFQGVEGVHSIQIIPDSYLTPQGGFANVDQLRSMLGIDIITLLSYEQTQFQDYKASSFWYLTLVGAYLIEGNQNETQTFVDASVFDISSRALLFNAGGRKSVEGDSTALKLAESLRRDSLEGFEGAVDAMIVQLQVALEQFRLQARSGTVRGAGTPAVQLRGQQGAGAAGWLELGLALLFAAALARDRRAAAA